MGYIFTLFVTNFKPNFEASQASFVQACVSTSFKTVPGVTLMVARLDELAITTTCADMVLLTLSSW